MLLPKQRSNIVQFSSLLLVGILFSQCARQEPSVDVIMERSKVLWERTEDLFQKPYDTFGAGRILPMFWPRKRQNRPDGCIPIFRR